MRPSAWAFIASLFWLAVAGWNYWCLSIETQQKGDLFWLQQWQADRAITLIFICVFTLTSLVSYVMLWRSQAADLSAERRRRSHSSASE
ncbi:hypothetical protein AB8B02_08780 [Tardiphaga sp. 862_B3_N4_1]|jgi:hypothetical protein|uniref:hypothetical protein n=1 Tax=Tardiphaga sp. 862_B3_N4_1 TaxID=3240764 RepID=UPI003F260140